MNRKKFGIVLLILAVFIIAVYAYFSVKKPESQNHDTSKKMENVTPKPDTDLYNSSTDTDPGTTSEDRSEESQEEEEGVPYQDSPITLSDFPEDAGQYFDQDISGIQTAIQTYALGYGYSADEAVWLKTITLDYNENSVETAFYLNCTDYPKVQITYYKDTHEFTSNAY